jgi:hypothetical protein
LANDARPAWVYRVVGALVTVGGIFVVAALLDHNDNAAQRTNIESVTRISGEARALDVDVPCVDRAVRVQIVEQDAREVRLRAFGHADDCTSVVRVRVRLVAPLGARRVIDDLGGRVVPVANP